MRRAKNRRLHAVGGWHLTVRCCLLAVVGWLLNACTGNTFYSHYESVSLDGWARADTLRFTTDSVRQQGQYGIDLALRTTSLYPFMNLALVVQMQASRSNLSLTDTLHFTLTDKEGRSESDGGLAYRQYSRHLLNYTLLEGDTLNVRIHHCMQQNPLPGISDVGIIVEKTDER